MAGDSPIRKLPKMAAGQRYGRLVAIIPVTMGRGSKWRFRCDCGNETVTRATGVRSGGTRSCGCLQRERARDGAKHGMQAAPEYSCWRSLLSRCRNPKNPGYRIYGGRGIKVCRRWWKFENFYADMGPRPSPEHSIDRIDNDGNYEPGNCRWATRKEQRRNQSTNRIVVYRGRKMTLAEACEQAAVPYDCAYSRLRRGWSSERTFAIRPAQGSKLDHM